MEAIIKHVSVHVFYVVVQTLSYLSSCMYVWRCWYLFYATDYVWILVRTKAKYKLLCGQILINHFSFWCLLMRTRVYAIILHRAFLQYAFCTHTHTYIYELMNLGWGLFVLFCWFFYKFFILIFSSALRLAPNQPQGRCFYWLAYACAIQCFLCIVPPFEKPSSIFFFPFK